MKSLFIVLFVLFGSVGAYAQNLEAKPFADVSSTLFGTQFQYKETGMIFGFVNLQSCMYTSPNMIVLKHYCYPRGNYPARSYTIISAKFGMIDIYEEKLSQVVQRDVMITAFPNAIGANFPEDLSSLKIAKVSNLIETLHFQYGPACWSTNFSRYYERPDFNCTVNKAAVSGFDDWAAETQALTGKASQWQKLLKDLDTKFPK